MTLIDIIIGLIVFGLAVLALKKVLRDKAQGRCTGCSGNCAGCCGCSAGTDAKDDKAVHATGPKAL